MLVLLSLVLITISFREPTSGPLHGIQSAGAAVMRPFEVGAERVARPFRDVYGYFRGLAHAKQENKRLRAELDLARQQAIQGESALQQNTQLRALLKYIDSLQFPSDYVPVNTRIVSRAPSEFDQRVVIAAGSDDGIRMNTPIVTQDGLVGRVTNVTSSEAQVTLLLDEDSAVEALDQDTRAYGLVRHGPRRGLLILDRVTKDQNIQRGNVIVTSGTRSRQYPSLFPRGIPIGQVVSVGQTDTAPYKAIQIQSYVNFGSLDSVIALVTKKHVPVAP